MLPFSSAEHAKIVKHVKNDRFNPSPFPNSKNKLNENIMNFYNLYVKSIISLKEIEKTYKNDSKVLSELYLLKKEINIKINKINNLNVKFINNIE